jgi:hypothetical protein
MRSEEVQRPFLAESVALKARRGISFGKPCSLPPHRILKFTSRTFARGLCPRWRRISPQTKFPRRTLGACRSSRNTSPAEPTRLQISRINPIEALASRLLVPLELEHPTSAPRPTDSRMDSRKLPMVVRTPPINNRRITPAWSPRIYPGPSLNRDVASYSSIIIGRKMASDIHLTLPTRKAGSMCAAPDPSSAPAASSGFKPPSSPGW